MIPALISRGRDENWDDEYENAAIAAEPNVQVEELIRLASRTGLFATQSHKNNQPLSFGKATQVSEQEKEIMKMQKTSVDEMKKDKRPAVNQSTPDSDCHKRCKQSPSTTLSVLEEEAEF